MACGRRVRVGGVGARHRIGSGPPALLITRAITAATCSAPDSAPPPRRRRRRPWSSLVRAAGAWVVSGPGSVRRSTGNGPHRPSHRLCRRCCPGAVPDLATSPPSLACWPFTAVEPRPEGRGPIPLNSGKARRPRARAEAPQAPERARAAAELRSCSARSRGVWLVALRRAALALSQLPRPRRSQNAGRPCARAEAPQAPELARAASEGSHKIICLHLPGDVLELDSLQ